MLFGQAESIDSSIVEKNGRKYYTYVVEQGNTLYSISKKYKISVKEIELHNPGVKEGLSIGDTLYILAVAKDKGVKKMKMEVNGNVIVHEVQKGQTLYAIAHIYDLTIVDLIEANPGVKDGVKEGQLIKIPVAKLKKQEAAPVVQEERSVRLHLVKSKETLYSLSQLYKVSAEEIKSANNGLVDGLKVGQEIVIPDPTNDLPIHKDSTEMKEVYKIAVILPFFLDLNDTLHASLKINDKEQVLSKSVVAIQFYQGCLMALDSLKKMGMRFDVKVYDSGKDSNVVDGLIEKGELSGVDLILGPFYQSQFTRVAEYARKKKIHIVSPVPLSNKVLLGNSYTSKVATSDNILFRNLGEYVSKFYHTENVLVITKYFRANTLANSFKKAYNQNLFVKGDSIGNGLKEIKWDNGSIDGIKAQLSDSVFNIILIPSNDQVYVTELLSKLNLLKDKYMFKIIGVENWMKYTNVDLEYYENLHVSIPTDAFIDYESQAVKKFIVSFNNQYKSFPENFSFLGFDVSFYFLKLLNEGGNRFEPLMEGRKEKYFSRNFDFFKTGIESGYENS
ncbi:MAG TPA: hypothetical protein DCX54_12730, partial [Flavobacteriales bacterium]|nr:hypothetical protein [Flavobacteriales bacterium]